VWRKLALLKPVGRVALKSAIAGIAVVSFGFKSTKGAQESRAYSVMPMAIWAISFTRPCDCLCLTCSEADADLIWSFLEDNFSRGGTTLNHLRLHIQVLAVRHSVKALMSKLIKMLSI